MSTLLCNVNFSNNDMDCADALTGTCMWNLKHCNCKTVSRSYVLVNRYCEDGFSYSPHSEHSNNMSYATFVMLYSA